MISPIYRRAKEVLFQKGWTQSVPMDQYGHVCLLQAIDMAAHQLHVTNHEHIRARTFFEWSVLDHQTAWMWNDMPSRKFEQVIDMLDLAVKRAEIMEASDAAV